MNNYIIKTDVEHVKKAALLAVLGELEEVANKEINVGKNTSSKDWKKPSRVRKTPNQ